MYYTFSQLKYISKLNEYEFSKVDEIKNLVKSVTNTVVPKIKRGAIYTSLLAAPLVTAAGPAGSISGNSQIYDNLPAKYQVIPKEQKYLGHHIEYLENNKENLPYYSNSDIIKDYYSDLIKHEGRPILKSKIQEAKDLDKTNFSCSSINFDLEDAAEGLGEAATKAAGSTTAPKGFLGKLVDKVRNAAVIGGSLLTLANPTVNNAIKLANTSQNLRLAQMHNNNAVHSTMNPGNTNEVKSQGDGVEVNGNELTIPAKGSQKEIKFTTDINPNNYTGDNSLSGILKASKGSFEDYKNKNNVETQQYLNEWKGNFREKFLQPFKLKGDRAVTYKPLDIEKEYQKYIDAGLSKESASKILKAKENRNFRNYKHNNRTETNTAIVETIGNIGETLQKLKTSGRR